MSSGRDSRFAGTGGLVKIEERESELEIS